MSPGFESKMPIKIFILYICAYFFSLQNTFLTKNIALSLFLHG